MVGVVASDRRARGLEVVGHVRRTSYFAATRVASLSIAANFFLDVGKPGGIIRVAHDLHLDRHEGVAGAAKFASTGRR